MVFEFLALVNGMLPFSEIGSKCKNMFGTRAMEGREHLVQKC